MRMLSFICLAVMFFWAAPTQAQELTKEEKKQVKNLLKQYKKNPEALLELTESADLYRDQNNQLQSQINTLSAEKQALANQVEQLEQSNVALNNQLLSAQRSIQQLQEEQPRTGTNAPANDDIMVGTVFRVQIGAFQKTYISDELAANDNGLTLEEQDGMQKVMVGQFRDYQQAKELMKHMKKIGLRDAWVVAYQDGSRVALDSVVSKDQQ